MAITATDKSALETASLEDQGEDQLAPLVSLIKLGLGKFTLATVRYQQPGQRQQIVASLRKALPGKSLVEISLQDSSLNLLSAPLQLFQSLEKLAHEHIDIIDYPRLMSNYCALTSEGQAQTIGKAITS